MVPNCVGVGGNASHLGSHAISGICPSPVSCMGRVTSIPFVLIQFVFFSHLNPLGHGLSAVGGSTDPGGTGS